MEGGGSSREERGEGRRKRKDERRPISDWFGGITRLSTGAWTASTCRGAAGAPRFLESDVVYSVCDHRMRVLGASVSITEARRLQGEG